MFQQKTPPPYDTGVAGCLHNRWAESNPDDQGFNMTGAARISDPGPM